MNKVDARHPKVENVEINIHHLFFIFHDADLGFHVGFVILPNTILNSEVNVDNIYFAYSAIF